MTILQKLHSNDVICLTLAQTIALRSPPTEPGLTGPFLYRYLIFKDKH